MGFDDTGVPSRYRRRRRNRKILIVTGGVLAFSGWSLGLLALAPGGDSSAPVCNAASAHDLVVHGPTNFDLNVFNSTNRHALAAQTAAQLKQRGFTIDLVTNDPLGSGLTIAAQVRGAKSEEAELRAVAAQVPGAQIQTDSRLDSSVDLILGSNFTTLARPQQAGCAH